MSRSLLTKPHRNLWFLILIILLFFVIPVNADFLTLAEMEQNGVEGVDSLEGTYSITTSRNGKPSYDASLEDDAVSTFSMDGTSSVMDVPCDTTALINAINTANSNNTVDTLNLAADCTYTLTNVDNNTDGDNGLPSITSKITFEGNGATIERSDAQGMPNFRIFHNAVSGSLTLLDLTARNGKAENGGGIYNKGTLTVENSTIRDNEIDNKGGGIWSSGTFELVNSTVLDNSATGSGGIHNYYGTLVLMNSVISGNYTSYASGGIGSDAGTVTINDSTITGNSTDYLGGGILGNSATISITNSTISNNESDWGGGVYVWEGSILYLTDSTIIGNTAGNAGGLYSTDEAYLTNSFVLNNIGIHESGGIRNGGLMELTNSTVSENSSGSYGGGILNTGIVHFMNSVISMNSAVYLGAGLWNSNVAVVTDSTINGNSTAQGSRNEFNSGGGIYNHGTLELSSSIVSENIVLDGGGGIRNSGGAVTITNGTIIHNNISEDLGGGIYNNAGMLKINDSIISENSANDFGGGLDVRGNSTVDIQNSQIMSNTAGWEGGGIAIREGASANIVNSKIYANIAQDGSGGGIGAESSGNINLSRSWVVANAAFNNDGGGVAVGYDGSAIIENSVIAGNSMGDPNDSGGGLYFYAGGGPYRIINSHIVGNYAAGKGAAIAATISAEVEVVNTLVISNTGQTGIDDKYGNNAIFYLDNCDTFGNSPDGAIGLTIIRNNCLGALPEDGVDPLMVGGGLPSGVGPDFADEWLNYDYSLGSNSSAIDSGDDDSCPFVDILGIKRPQGSACDIGAYESTTPTVLYVSFNLSGRIDDLQFSNEDILAYDINEQTWSLFFDGSDVLHIHPFHSSDLDAFHIMDDGSILMSFSLPFWHNGFGWVSDSDVLRFVPTSLGEDTTGIFEWYLDGSDVGLNRRFPGGVDAITMTEDGRLVISTKAPHRLPADKGHIKVADEDLIVFNATSLGNMTRGTWELYFDGSDAELKSETVDGVWIDENSGEIYLSVQDEFTVSGLTGNGKDIFICQPISLGEDTNCTYVPELFFDGSEAVFGRRYIDGISLLP